MSSPRRHGSTAQLLEEALRGAKEAGADTEIIYLPDYTIEYCKGCQQCLSHEKCGINDDLNPLLNKVLGSEGVILASPTYEEDMNAMMKNFLDRIMPYIGYRSAFRGKYAGGISTAGGFGAKQAAQKMMIINSGFHKMGYITGTLGALVGWGDVQPYLPKAYQLGSKMALDIKHKRKYPLQALGKKLAFALFIRRFMEKVIVSNKDGKRKAVYQYLKREGIIH